MERSDRGYFEDMQTFGRVHRKLAMAYFSTQQFDMAEYHFSEELAMMLLDEDSSSRVHALQFISQLRRNTPLFAPSATEKESQTLLNMGISAFNKGPSGYASAADLLLKAIRQSRLCGSEVVSSLDFFYHPH